LLSTILNENSPGSLITGGLREDRTWGEAREHACGGFASGDEAEQARRCGCDAKRDRIPDRDTTGRARAQGGQLRAILSIAVTTVEIKDIDLNETMVRAIAKQAEAKRMAIRPRAPAMGSRRSISSASCARTCDQRGVEVASENAAQAQPAAPYLLHRLVVPGAQSGLAGVRVPPAVGRGAGGVSREHLAADGRRERKSPRAVEAGFSDSLGPTRPDCPAVRRVGAFQSSSATSTA